MTDATIFAAALEKKNPADRDAFLAVACAGDRQLRQRIDDLLAAHAKAGSFLVGAAGETPAGEVHDGKTQWLGPPRAAIEPPDAPPAEDPLDEVFDFIDRPKRPDSLGRLGHYDLLEVLGKGGFGIVFRAFDERLQRVVAIKVMSPEMAATSPARKRFIREARASAPIRHENVVQVHAIEEDPLPYLVMEYIPGQNLQAVLDGTGPLEAPDVVRIATQLARGLAAAHERGLIHRDIKPANILLEGGLHGRVKLTDFGLARTADDASITQSGMVAGTPLYMSPEQSRGDSIDHRSDLFSLGSVLYTVCAGHPPFRANSSIGVLQRVAEAAPRPIREVIPETPDWLCRIIGKLHARNPDDRFQSAAEVAAVLADCEAQLKAHATVKDLSRIPERMPTVGRAEPAEPTRRPRWVIPAVVAAVVVLIGVATLVYQFGTGNSPPDNTPPVNPPLAGPPVIVPGPPGPGLPPFPPLGKPSPPDKPTTPPLPPAPPANVPPLEVLLTSPDWVWTPPTNLGPGINTVGQGTVGRELSATLTADELEIVFERDRKLFTARRDHRDRPFPPAAPLSPEINSGPRESPSLTADGLVLVYAVLGTQRKELWETRRADRGKPFGPPTRLGDAVNADVGGGTAAPVLSADGLTLYATRFIGAGPTPDGLGGGDIARFARKSLDDPFELTGFLGPGVNSPDRDVAAWLSDGGRVLIRQRFASPPETRFHIRGRVGDFGPPQAFDIPGVTGDVGRPWLSPNGTRIYFHARLPEGSDNLDLWYSDRVPKNP